MADRWIDRRSEEERRGEKETQKDKQICGKRECIKATGFA